MALRIKHNDDIRLSSWVNNYATVHTIQGYALDNFKNPHEAVLTAELTNEPLVWANQTGTVMYNDDTARKEHRKAVQSAIIVTDGQIVIVESPNWDDQVYMVKVVSGNNGAFPVNSDPIHFERIKA